MASDLLLSLSLPYMPPVSLQITSRCLAKLIHFGPLATDEKDRFYRAGLLFGTCDSKRITVQNAALAICSSDLDPMFLKRGPLDDFFATVRSATADDAEFMWLEIVGWFVFHNTHNFDLTSNEIKFHNRHFVKRQAVGLVGTSTEENKLSFKAVMSPDQGPLTRFNQLRAAEVVDLVEETRPALRFALRPGVHEMPSRIDRLTAWRPFKESAPAVEREKFAPPLQNVPIWERARAVGENAPVARETWTPPARETWSPPIRESAPPPVWREPVAPPPSVWREPVAPPPPVWEEPVVPAARETWSPPVRESAPPPVWQEPVAPPPPVWEEPVAPPARETWSPPVRESAPPPVWQEPVAPPPPVWEEPVIPAARETWSQPIRENVPPVWEEPVPPPVTERVRDSAPPAWEDEKELAPAARERTSGFEAEEVSAPALRETTPDRKDEWLLRRQQWLELEKTRQEAEKKRLERAQKWLDLRNTMLATWHVWFVGLERWKQQTAWVRSPRNWLIAAGLCTVALCSIALRRPAPVNVVKDGATPAAAAQQQSAAPRHDLRLNVEPFFDQLMVTWDHDGEIATAAKGGVLVIDDGTEHHTINMDRAHVLNGLLLYKPQSPSVSFTLTVQNQRGQQWTDKASFTGAITENPQGLNQ